jgi:hypothetical protein
VTNTNDTGGVRVSDDALREILAGTEGVTPGPWSGCHGGNCECGYVFGDSGVAYIFKALSLSDDVDPVAGSDARKANSKHIARLDPGTVRSIVTELLEHRSASGDVRTYEDGRVDGLRDAFLAQPKERTFKTPAEQRAHLDGVNQKTAAIRALLHPKDWPRGDRSAIEPPKPEVAGLDEKGIEAVCRAIFRHHPATGTTHAQAVEYVTAYLSALPASQDGEKAPTYGDGLRKALGLLAVDVAFARDQIRHKDQELGARMLAWVDQSRRAIFRELVRWEHPAAGPEDLTELVDAKIPPAPPTPEAGKYADGVLCGKPEQVLTEATEAVTLDRCPIGLFRSSSGALCLKTEYGNNEGRIDAYIVDSGEFFWGVGAQTIAAQRAQLVFPVLISPFPPSGDVRTYVDGVRAALEAAPKYFDQEAAYHRNTPASAGTGRAAQYEHYAHKVREAIEALLQPEARP